MGLGLLGRGLGDIRFLAGQGAELTVTDLKTAEQLQSSLLKLKKYPKIKYVLGRHRLADFSARGGQASPDLILKAAGVPLDSPYIAEARKYNVPVEMSTALFAKIAKEAGVHLIGVTGTRGKTTVTYLVYEILKRHLGLNRPRKGAVGRTTFQVVLGGNIRGVSTLPLLKKVRAGDWAVLELDSWQLQGFGENKISPEIAVFTNLLPDHLNYYGSLKKYFADKVNIFRYQNKGGHLVVGEQVEGKVKAQSPKGQMEIVNQKLIPKAWKVKMPGEHNRSNAALALAAARAANIPDKISKQVFKTFPGVPGRLELIRDARGIKVYNDTTSTTPDAPLAALKALGSKKKVILIAGGSDKGLPLGGLVKELSKYVKRLILLPGSGSEKLKDKSAKYSALNLKEITNLQEAVGVAVDSSRRGDTILFSPGFASFGLFKNEYDRGDQFVKLIKKIK